MKFTPGIQLTSKNRDFFGFTTIYHRQGQLDILKVIEGKESPKDFLQSCCLNNLIGDYLFLFYVSSLDHKDVREFPIHVAIKKWFFRPISTYCKKKNNKRYHIMRLLYPIYFFGW